jgi:hypothetical protein
MFVIIITRKYIQKLMRNSKSINKLRHISISLVLITCGLIYVLEILLDELTSDDLSPIYIGLIFQIMMLLGMNFIINLNRMIGNPKNHQRSLLILI